MKNIKLDKNQIVFLKATEGTTVSKALHEAIEFCKENEVDECQLNFNGYLFDIKPKSNYAEKFKEYTNSPHCKMNAIWILE